MFGETMYWLLNMSIAGSIVGIIIFLVRAMPCVPKRVAVWLWGVVMVRWTVPYGIGSHFGLMALLSKFFSKTVLVYTDGTFTVSSMNFVQEASDYYPITFKSLWIDGVFRVAGIVWFTVLMVLLILVFAEYEKTHRVVLRAKPGKGVWYSPEINGPFVFGIFRPKIIVPQGFSCDRYILLHERMHIRRGDNIWRLMAFAVVCVHWFNPLAWMFLRIFLHDLEMACDEDVLSKCSSHEQVGYAKSLLKAAQSRVHLVSAFKSTSLYSRISHILSYKRMTVVSLTASVVLVGFMAYSLLTNAV